MPVHAIGQEQLTTRTETNAQCVHVGAAQLLWHVSLFQLAHTHGSGFTTMTGGARSTRHHRPQTLQLQKLAARWEFRVAYVISMNHALKARHRRDVLWAPANGAEPDC